MTDDQICDLSLAYRLALTAMIHGAADEQQWSTCVTSLNLALVLAEGGTGEECIQQINEALEGAFIRCQVNQVSFALAARSMGFGAICLRGKRNDF